MSRAMYSPLGSVAKNNTITVASFSTISDNGTVSELAEIIRPTGGILGSHMVAAAPGIFGLSKNQVYYYNNNASKKTEIVEAWNPSRDKPGDLRIYVNTAEGETSEDGILYEGVISKYDRTITFVKLARPVQTYLRLAEAINGLSDEGWQAVRPDTVPAYELAMDILKKGLKERMYQLIKQTGTEMVPFKKVNIAENGDTVKVEVDGVLVPDTIYGEVEKPVFVKDSLNFKYDEFSKNNGIHARGSGQVAQNTAYAIDNDSCIAIYFNKPIVGYKPVLDKDGNPTYDTEGNEITVADYGITEDDRREYVRNLIIDECALELCFEGYRFTDLVRFANAAGDVDVLAKRVAGRAFENTVNYYNPSYQYDADLYEKLTDKSNWFLPLK